MEVYIAVLVAFVAYALSSVKYMHYFQLNSYAHDTQKRWMKNYRKKLVPNFVFAIIGGLALLLPGGYIFSAVVFLSACFVNRYRKAKKPVVFTARVKRLYATVLLVFIAVTAGVAFINAFAAALFAAVMYLLNPVIIIFADTVNSPVERGVKNHYINDAKKILNSSNAKVIGITGSYGKTSVKYYLNTLLESTYDSLMTPESYNTPMGVVKTVREKMNARHEYFVCEMGARRVGDIKEICDIVHPGLGVITSVGPQHLETFGTLENVKKTKFELAQAIGDGGILFINGDDENVLEYAKNFDKLKKISYGTGRECTYRADVISVSSRGTVFSVTVGDDSCEYSTKLIGKHNVINIAGAVAVANTLGIPLQKLILPVKRLEGVPHRLQLTDNGQAVIIDDAYNSNPTGAGAALDTLALFEEYKILVTPGMVELGDKQYECNKEFGSHAARVCDYIILVGQKQSVPILDGMGDYPKDRYYVADTVNDAIQHAYSVHTEGRKKVILLENDLPDNYLA